MRVDVLISGQRPNGDSSLGTITRTLLQNLEVLSAGTDFKKDPEGKPVQVQVINLLVTPEQAELLSLASAQTQIQLVLRNPLDRDVTKTSGTALALLFNGGKLKAEADPAPAAAARPRAPRVASGAPRPSMPAAELPAPKKEEPFVMEIISGTKKNEQKFIGSGEGK
jgi:pilus assembly protein CpaB